MPISTYRTLLNPKEPRGIQPECGILIHGQGDVPCLVSPGLHTVSLTHARIIDNPTNVP